MKLFKQKTREQRVNRVIDYLNGETERRRKKLIVDLLFTIIFVTILAVVIYSI